MNTIKALDFNPELRSYTSGDTIICQIQQKTKGGFIVALPNKDIRSAFLPTCLDLSIGLPLEVFYTNEDRGQLVFSLTDEEFRKYASRKVRTYHYH